MSNRAQRKVQWNTILPWVELASATVLGIVLFFPLQRKDLADIVWVLGLLLTFNSLAITRSLKEEFDAMRKVSEVVDLSQECDVEGISRILRLYLAIRETEFRPLKNDTIQRCIAQLIPESAEMEGTMRAFNAEHRTKLLRRIREIAQGIAIAMGGSCEVEIFNGCPPCVNDVRITEIVRNAAIVAVGEKEVDESEDVMTAGSDDMACFLEAVPGCYFIVGAKNEEKGANYPHHHPRFNIDEDALPIGVEVLTRAAMDFLKK